MRQHSPKAVEIRAFRGTRRTSVYRDHAVTEAEFGEIVSAAGGSGLELLASLDRRGPHRLDKPTARRLAVEVESIRRSVELLELDGDLTAIAEVARWCARAPGPAWLTIAGH